MGADFQISAIGLCGVIFVGATLTWLFWNGVFAIIRYILTGTI